jgi:DNA replication protein DnaC
METKFERVSNLAHHLSLTGLEAKLEELVNRATEEQSSFLDFALKLLSTEVDHRNYQNLVKRLKVASLPITHDLKQWEDEPQNGISLQQLAQLQECLWLEQNFNLILMGPSGSGKTFLAAGLCFEALQKGYKACFRTMDRLNYILKMKDITRTAAREYDHLTKVNLLVIDDIMMFPMEKKQAVALFNLVDYLHQRASMIITTNKSPDEWAKVLDDEVLTTAILDRLLFKCEIIKLHRTSYRLDHRQSIFS